MTTTCRPPSSTDLGLPGPDFHLGVGSGSHAEQTGRVMIAYGRSAAAHRPDWLIVAGDVNSTVACALVGTKLGIRTAHLEAGLRSRDRRMPEELNRLATDVLCDVLWTPSPDADHNLRAEGIPAERISRVGNIMLDSFEMRRAEIEAADMAARAGRGARALCNRHPAPPLQCRRAGDAASPGREPEGGPATTADHISGSSAHGRAAGGGGARSGRLRQAGVLLIPPAPYIGFMSLVLGAGAVITDSGGLQEETTYLGIPCFTLRENTERPITIEQGTNVLATPDSLPRLLDEALARGDAGPRRPEYWDGRTAGRCVEDLRRRDGGG